MQDVAVLRHLFCTQSDNHKQFITLVVEFHFNYLLQFCGQGCQCSDFVYLCEPSYKKMKNNELFASLNSVTKWHN